MLMNEGMKGLSREEVEGRNLFVGGLVAQEVEHGGDGGEGGDVVMVE